MLKSLVTGGCGFVGRHLVRKLLERGDEVTVVDSLVDGTGGISPRKWPNGHPSITGNFFYSDFDCRMWFDHRPTDRYDYVFHLAAIVGGREMIEKNPLAVADDLSIDASYWQWASRAKPGKTVYFSSSAVYPVYMQSEGYAGLGRQTDFLQEADVDFDSTGVGIPDLSYGWAKLTGEFLARLAYQKHGLKSICFRPFSGYGEDQDAAYPFPAICKRAVVNAATNAPVFGVWGTGDQIRDFIHIDDCIDGVLALVDKIDDGSAVNLSTGVGTSFKELAAMVCGAIGYHPKIVGNESKPSGVFCRVGDTTKQRELGFTPKIPLAEGVRRAMEHFSRA